MRNLPTAGRLLGLATMLVVSHPVLAQPAEPAAEAATPAAAAAPAPEGPAEQEAPKGFWDRANLTGDWGGVRTRLSDRGITFGLSDLNETLGNASGGTRRGVIYEGLTEMSMGLDTGKAFGWEGGTFNVSAVQIRGRGLSYNNLDNNLNTVSSAEASRGTLLFELWYEQLMFDKKLGVRIGQMAADQEFMISQYAALFVNSTFGWNTLVSADLPSGGPAYPLATPGVRVRWIPSDRWALLAAAFNGNPAGPGQGNPQLRDPSGTAFRLNDGVFAIAEVQYGLNQGEGATGLPGTYKLGAFYNSNGFPDQRFNVAGLSLANPLAEGTAPKNRGANYGLYGVVDQLVWRRPGSKDGGVGVFLRATGVPNVKNLVSFYADAGVTWKGPFESRPDDTVGLGFAYARISERASKLDSDTRYYTANPAYPIRRNESVLELTYQAQVTGWLQVQPTAQYVFNLLGGVLNPANPGKRLGDAAVFGLRATVTY